MLIGDGRYDNTLSLQSLFDQGGKITIPEGVYLTGPLTISKSADIRFEEGAVIRFIPDFSLYKPVYTRWEGVKCWCMHPCLYIKDASCVTLSGKGVIDGSGDVWWNQANARRNAGDGPQSEIEKKFAALNPDFESQPGGGGGRQVQFLRPPLVQIHSSQDVTIDGLRLQNSPFWTLHPLFSKNITLKNLMIENPAEAPNTDGIVTNCTVKAAHGGAVIGSETAAGINNVTVSGCTFDGTDRGIRIKSRRGRGGCLHDLRFENLVMKNNLCPLVVNMYYRCGCSDMSLFSLDEMPLGDETPSLYNLEVINCTGIDARSSAAMLVGLPESPLRNVSIRNCSFSIARENLEPVDRSDMYLGLPEITCRGIRLRFIDNPVLENIHVEGASQDFIME